jgi:hypothetical protein
LTFEAWLESVKSGRTFVTNGPMLEFRVDGKGMGEEVDLKNPGRLVVEGRGHPELPTGRKWGGDSL